MDGQSFNIPLNSAITIRSERMFESVQAPKMLYNPQLYQNGVLQNSFRFEHDGFASGDNVYEFVGLSGFIDTKPEGYTVTKAQYTTNPTYSIEFAGTGYALKYNAIAESILLIDPATNNLVVTTNNALTTLTGELNDIAFTVNYNHLTHEVIDDQDRFAVTVATDNNYITTFTIEDLTNTQHVAISNLNVGSFLKSTYGLTADEKLDSAKTFFAQFKTLIDNVYTWEANNIIVTLDNAAVTFIDTQLQETKYLFTSPTNYIEVSAQDNSTIYKGSYNKDRDNNVTFSFSKTYSIATHLPLSSEDYSLMLTVNETLAEQKVTCNVFTDQVKSGVYTCAIDTAQYLPTSTIKGRIRIPQWTQLILPATGVKCALNAVPLHVIGQQNHRAKNIRQYTLIPPTTIDLSSAASNDILSKYFTHISFINADASLYDDNGGAGAAYYIEGNKRIPVYFYPKFMDNIQNTPEIAETTDLYKPYILADDTLAYTISMNVTRVTPSGYGNINQTFHFMLCLRIDTDRQGAALVDSIILEDIFTNKQSSFLAAVRDAIQNAIWTQVPSPNLVDQTVYTGTFDKLSLTIPYQNGHDVELLKSYAAVLPMITTQATKNDQFIYRLLNKCFYISGDARHFAEHSNPVQYAITDIQEINYSKLFRNHQFVQYWKSLGAPNLNIRDFPDPMVLYMLFADNGPRMFEGTQLFEVLPAALWSHYESKALSLRSDKAFWCKALNAYWMQYVKSTVGNRATVRAYRFIDYYDIEFSLVPKAINGELPKYFTSQLSTANYTLDTTCAGLQLNDGMLQYQNGKLVFTLQLTQQLNIYVHSLSAQVYSLLDDIFSVALNDDDDPDAHDYVYNILQPKVLQYTERNNFVTNYTTPHIFTDTDNLLSLIKESNNAYTCAPALSFFDSETTTFVNATTDVSFLLEGSVFNKLVVLDSCFSAEDIINIYQHKDRDRLYDFFKDYVENNQISHEIRSTFQDNIDGEAALDITLYTSTQDVIITFYDSEKTVLNTLTLNIVTTFRDAKKVVTYTMLNSTNKSFHAKDLDLSYGLVRQNTSGLFDVPVFEVTEGVYCALGYNYSIQVHSTDDKKDVPRSIDYYDWLNYYKLNFLVTVPYTLEATLCNCTDALYTLTKVDNNYYHLQHTVQPTAYIAFNRNTFKCIGTTVGGIAFEERYPNIIANNDVYNISFDLRYTLNVPCILKGIVATTGFNIVSYTDSTIKQVTVTLPEDLTEYTVDLDKLFSELNTSRLKIISTDIHTNETREIKTIDCETELQVLTQQWDTTTETESYWWINSTHILKELDTQFVLLEKTGYIDNWKADSWKVVNSISKDSVLSTRALDYDVTSAYNCNAMFFTLADNDILNRTTTSTNTIYIQLYDVLDNFKPTLYTVPVVTKALGQPLNGTGAQQTINTYSDITATYILNTSKISSTCIDDFVLIGFHCDNNFNQWTVIINKKLNTFTVFQGYGFVGIDGALTGGEIPSNYVNALVGFSSIVEPLRSLDLYDATKDAVDYTITKLELLQYDEDKTKIVGTDKQQWYIRDKITAIVSHCLFEVKPNAPYGYSIKLEELRLNNNYSVLYHSGSFRRSIFGDLNPDLTAVADLLADTGVSQQAISLWQGIWRWGTNPFVLIIQPRLSNINYLQQSLGQYAYVHYNSTKQTAENVYKSTDQKQLSDVVKTSEWEPERKLLHALSEDEVAFDVQSIPQTSAYAKIDAIKNVLLFALVQTGIDLIKQIPTAINNLINQTTTSSFGKQFSQAFSQNLTNMTNTQLSLNTLFASITSEVTAVKSLDMFYSTSALQKVNAGRGYVNHNFVAQCVAQSVTSTHLELSQVQLYYLVKELALWQLEIVYWAEEFAADALRVAIEGIPTGGDISYAFSVAASVLAIAAYTAIGIHKEYIKALRDVGGPLLAGFGGDRLRSMLTAGKSHHEYAIEGKHKYGSKAEHFMWPCFKARSVTKITDEGVQAAVLTKSWLLNAPTKRFSNKKSKLLDAGDSINFVTNDINKADATNWNNVKVPAYYVGCKGTSSTVALPTGMSCVIGVDTFLSPQWFKNENINESEPVFPVPIIHDYCLNNDWKLGITASAGETIWVSVGDTKIIDGDYTNIVINKDEFCGIASTYTAVELKHGIFEQYVRPFNLTPKVLGLNNTGYNVLYDDTLYHGFDGFGYRIESWIGSSGMNKDFQTLQYNFIANDRFKRSNKLPPNQFLGNFKTDPICNLTCNMDDKIVTIITQPSNNTGITVGVPGEDKDVLRYAIPVCAEPITLAPATIKTLSSYELSVVDGVTSICTDIRNTQSEYKANTSVDFNLQGKLYRYCDEYISELTNESGVVVANKLVLCIGLEFLGASPYEAYFYNYDTKLVYIYTGGTSITIFGRAERFDRIKSSNYDFINQCIVLTYTGNESLVLNNRVFDRNIMPPTKLIYNEESGYKVNSLAGGYVFQGPNRCSITRAVYSPYMLKDILKNRGNWKKMNKYDYIPRDYQATFEHVTKSVNTALDGWTHNPFVFQTAPLGLSEDIDALFEWTITFAWNDVMDQIYTNDMYAVVNIDALSYAPGGTIESNVAHVYLTKRLFGKDTSGYYSYKFISNSGACNRESLRIWSDAVIAVSNLTVTVKPVTQNRASVLTQHVDVQNMQEL